MPFTIRAYHRFPVLFPVTYYVGLHQGHGTLWNFSPNGWCLSGDVPLRIGQTIPLTVVLPNSLYMLMGVKIKISGITSVEGPREGHGADRLMMRSP